MDLGLAVLSIFTLVGFLFLLLNFGAIKAPLSAKCVLVALGLVAMWFLLSTWLWTLNYRKLGLPNSWTFLVGPRPEDSVAQAAWFWGRQAFWAWLLAAALLVVFTILLD